MNHNYDDTSVFSAGASTASGIEFFVHGYLEFDLDVIPNKNRIQEAKLSLFANTTTTLYGQGVYNSESPGHSTLSGSNAFYLQRVTSPWQEDTLTWNNQPTVSTQSQVSAPGSTHPAQEYVIDAFGLIQAMNSNLSNNYGFRIKLQDQRRYCEVTFSISDVDIAADRPKLVLKAY